jgi:ankyrin repeat protein
MAQGHLFWIESEHLELPTPFGRRIAEPFDADAPGQTAFYVPLHNGHYDFNDAMLPIGVNCFAEIVKRELP